MKDKKNLIIILCVLVILGLIGFICYDKGVFGKRKDINNGNNTEETNKQNETENVEFSDSELEDYVSYINPVSIGPSAKLYNVDKISSSELTAREKIEYIGSSIFKKQQGLTQEQYLNEGNGKYDAYILESDVKSGVEKVFGDNTYEKTIFNLGCGDYNLNESNGKYYTKTGCGGATTNFVSNVVIDYKATKSKLEITTAYAFILGDNKIYKDYGLSVVLGEYTGESHNIDELEAYLKEYIKNNKDKLNTIVYTFESTDGRNYYFTGLVNNK